MLRRFGSVCSWLTRFITNYYWTDIVTITTTFFDAINLDDTIQLEDPKSLDKVTVLTRGDA